MYTGGQLPAHVDFRTECRRELSGCGKSPQRSVRDTNLTEETHFIASTGIEGRYFDPMVFVTMDTYAVSGICPGQIRYLYAPEHLNRTYEYGVTFERGTAVTYGDRRHVFISGTASIDRYGEIVHAGDVIKQTSRMIENIEALLKEADATLNDIMQAVIYIRDTADYARVKRYIDEHHPSLPYIIVRAPVCRTGWLVEMECTAVTAKGDETVCGTLAIWAESFYHNNNEAPTELLCRGLFLCLLSFLTEVQAALLFFTLVLMYHLFALAG